MLLLKRILNPTLLKTNSNSPRLPFLFILGIVTIWVLTSCAVVPKLALQPDVEIETLSICVSYTEEVPLKVQENIDSTISVFVENFNAESHAFYLGSCEDSERSALRIDINETHLVSKSTQWSSTILSLAGLSLPFIMIAAEAPIYVFFYSFPNDVSLVDLSLSSDIGSPNVLLNRKVVNSGYLMSEKRQILKHGIAFNNFLKRELLSIEREYNKQEKIRQ